MEPFSTILLTSGDLLADRRFEWARDCEAKGDLAGAADLLAQALERVPRYAPAWFVLGEIRVRLDDRAGAAAAFDKARAADPDDRHGAALHLSRLGAQPAGEMPPAYVRALFDHYAPRFDRALGALDYRGPELVLAAVKGVAARMKFATALDLGCGTGLAGEAFRPYVDRLTGVDLSGGMVAQARGKGIYDRLVETDVLRFVADEAEVKARYHLIFAADVFVYFHALAPLTQAIARVLAPDGLLAFTVETHDSAGIILRETLRFAHGAAEVRAALGAAGLKERGLFSAATRTEKKVPVPGLVVLASH